MPDIIFENASKGIINDGNLDLKGITKDTYIYAGQGNGGHGDTTFEHYGNFKYNGKAYFKNTGDRPVIITTYTATGHSVHEFTLEPEKNNICYFTQTVLKWNLCDGKGTAKVVTPDGGTGVLYFRYNVLEQDMYLYIIYK